MRYLPIHVDMKEADVLIVGGFAAAEAKLRTLIKTEARLILVAPEIGPEIKRWVDDARILWEKRDFLPTDLKSKRLVYAATEDDQVNGEIAALCRAQGLLVNAADYKDACDFITPALVDRSPVAISIGTEGTSPGLARAIKADLETTLPSTLGRFALVVNRLRAQVKKVLPSIADRQRLWAEIFGGNDLASQLRLSEEALEQAVNQQLAGDVKAKGAKAGMVSLVGAGPGDPDLLTHQARNKLHNADVIIYDRLVSEGVMAFGRREAEYIYVGKEPSINGKCGKATPQAYINEIIVEKAREGGAVVRLKSGDPLIFGRADEEIDALIAANVSFEICPGITSASAAAASLKTSLTTRGINKSVTFMTGHDAKGFAEQDWLNLAKDGARAAVYMGIGASGFIQGRLAQYGAKRDLPITIVENASREDEKIIASTLASLTEDLKKAGIKGPALLMVGYKHSDIKKIKYPQTGTSQ